MSRTVIWNYSTTDQTLPAAYGELVIGPGNGFVTTDSIQTVVTALGGFAAMNGKFNVFPIDDAETLGERQISAVSGGGDGGGGGSSGGPIYAADVLGLALVATTGSYGNLINKPALKPVATSGSFSDLTDKPTIPAASSDLPESVGTAFAGSSPDFARKDHVHAHGDQTGGSTHAVATPLAHGFMSSVDKSRFDALVPSVANPADVAAAASAGTEAAYARADHAHAHGNQAGGALHSDATIVSSGFMSATDKIKLDGVNPGSAVAAVDVSSAAGSSADFARVDHVHAHGAQTDETLHATATTSAAGFMSAADKTKINNLATVASSGDFGDLSNKPEKSYDFGSYKPGSISTGATIAKYQLPRAIRVDAFTQGPSSGGATVKLVAGGTDVTTFPTNIAAGVVVAVVCTADGVDSYWTVKAVEA